MPDTKPKPMTLELVVLLAMLTLTDCLVKWEMIHGALKIDAKNGKGEHSHPIHPSQCELWYEVGGIISRCLSVKYDYMCSKHMPLTGINSL